MAGDTPSPEAAGLLHIEDAPLWTDAVARILSPWPEMRYIGQATTGSDGLAMCRERRPAIVLLDLYLPDVDGFTVAEQLADLPDPPRVLVFTCRADEAALYRLKFCPVDGLVWKTVEFPEQLYAALTALLAGRSYFPPEVQAALSRFRSSPTSFSKILSPAEIDLLPRFGGGATDKEIAADTALSAVTIKWHRYQIMQKLDLHRTIDLMRWAQERGFVEDRRPAPPCLLAG